MKQLEYLEKTLAVVRSLLAILTFLAVLYSIDLQNMSDRKAERERLNMLSLIAEQSERIDAATCAFAERNAE